MNINILIRHAMQFSINLICFIEQKINILVVAMQKILLTTIFIREVNDFNLFSDFKYKLNQTSFDYEKITIRFCCFCMTATVPVA